MNTLAFLVPFIAYYGGYVILALIAFGIILALFGENGGLIALFAAIIALSCTSCTQGPQKLVIRPDGTKEYYSTGGSLLTKSKGAYARHVLPDGTVMEHGSRETNEVGMPTMSVVGGLVGQGIQEAGNLGNAALKK
jgi:hypothetical protein